VPGEGRSSCTNEGDEVVRQHEKIPFPKESGLASALAAFSGACDGEQDKSLAILVSGDGTLSKTLLQSTRKVAVCGSRGSLAPSLLPWVRVLADGGLFLEDVLGLAQGLIREDFTARATQNFQQGPSRMIPQPQQAQFMQQWQQQQALDVHDRRIPQCLLPSVPASHLPESRSTAPSTPTLVPSLHAVKGDFTNDAQPWPRSGLPLLQQSMAEGLPPGLGGDTSRVECGQNGSRTDLLAKMNLGSGSSLPSRQRHALLLQAQEQLRMPPDTQPLHSTGHGSMPSERNHGKPSMSVSESNEAIACLHAPASGEKEDKDRLKRHRSPKLRLRCFAGPLCKKLQDEDHVRRTTHPCPDGLACPVVRAPETPETMLHMESFLHPCPKGSACLDESPGHSSLFEHVGRSIMPLCMQVGCRAGGGYTRPVGGMGRGGGNAWEKQAMEAALEECHGGVPHRHICPHGRHCSFLTHSVADKRVIRHTAAFIHPCPWGSRCVARKSETWNWQHMLQFTHFPEEMEQETIVQEGGSNVSSLANQALGRTWDPLGHGGTQWSRGTHTCVREVPSTFYNPPRGGKAVGASLAPHLESQPLGRNPSCPLPERQELEVKRTFSSPCTSMSSYSEFDDQEDAGVSLDGIHLQGEERLTRGAGAMRPAGVWIMEDVRDHEGLPRSNLVHAPPPPIPITWST